MQHIIRLDIRIGTRSLRPPQSLVVVSTLPQGERANSLGRPIIVHSRSSPSAMALPLNPSTMGAGNTHLTVNDT